MKPFFELDSIESPIAINAPSGNWSLVDRNGIEPDQLAQFRDDLRALREARRGSVYFGDHDSFDIIDMRLMRGNLVRVVANNPPDDLWNIEVGEYPSTIIEDLIHQVDEIEREFGSLDGYCKACGRAYSKFRKGGWFLS